LEYWLERFSVEVTIRHAALGDALATAQLAQIAFRKALSRGLLNFSAVARLARDARWLPR
jgi:DNA polymerase III epsilon subunit-like protein